MELNSSPLHEEFQRFSDHTDSMNHAQLQFCLHFLMKRYQKLHGNMDMIVEVTHLNRIHERNELPGTVDREGKERSLIYTIQQNEKNGRWVATARHLITEIAYCEKLDTIGILQKVQAQVEGSILDEEDKNIRTLCSSILKLAGFKSEPRNIKGKGKRVWLPINKEDSLQDMQARLETKLAKKIL